MPTVAQLNSIEGSSSQRSRRPVFVTGCHRSGTNLLYDILLAAGGFAVYRGYIPIYKTLIPHFGPLENIHNRKRIIDTWILSKGFLRSGLVAQQLTEKLLSGAGTGGDFLRIIMGEISQKQGVDRWAVYDPDNLLRIPRIKADIPDALFIHIIRDGRDIALSLKKMGGFTPFPWSRHTRSLLETALYWEWMVRKGRAYGRAIPSDYIEIHYENLVKDPASTLAQLSKFLDHDLDYERVRHGGLERKSNSSFLDEMKPGAESPVNRWRHRLSPTEVISLESHVGSCLVEFGYDLTVPEVQRQPHWWQAGTAAAYRSFLDTKLWLKQHTPLSRLANLSELELPESASGAEEQPSI
ncbi:MAG TPA: sulfotransferase [Candidatus Sulfotelmatobacter sp.]|nr:sulfotransferase [Candidatus Sulfotelmatobacter sp.]